MTLEDKKKLKNLEKLVLRAQNGDIQAFGLIYDFFIDKIYRYILFKVREEEALDLTENVFLKAWDNLKKYKFREGAGFSAWLFRIAHNVVVDFFRLNKKSLELNFNIADERRESNPLLMTDLNLSRERVWRALGALKEQYREVLQICFLSEYSNEEASKILGKSDGALRVLKCRALQEMKKVLEQEEY